MIKTTFFADAETVHGEDCAGSTSYNSHTCSTIQKAYGDMELYLSVSTNSTGGHMRMGLMRMQPGHHEANANHASYRARGMCFSREQWEIVAKKMPLWSKDRAGASMPPTRSGDIYRRASVPSFNSHHHRLPSQWHPYPHLGT